MAASSDSSDEDMEKFAAIAGIVDSEVVKFNGNSQASSKSKLHTALKPSLRHWREDEDAACSTSALITPEFRHHVAKKLAKFLDSNYVCTQEVQRVQNGHHNCPHDQTTGIKLLLSSGQRLLEESGSDTKEMPSYTARRKKGKKYSSSSESGTDEEELDRLAEAAVSGYSIIQKAPNGNREEVEDESNEMSSLKRKKEKKLKKEKKKKGKLDEEVQKKSKHKKRKKEKHKTK